MLTFVMSAALFAGCGHEEAKVITSEPCVLGDEHPLCGVRRITIKTTKTLPKGVPIHDLDTWDVEISLDERGRILEWLVRDPETRKESRQAFGYNADGLLKENVWYTISGKPFVTYRFEYDEKQRLVEKTTIDHAAVGYVYKPGLRPVKVPGKGKEGLLILERHAISEDGATRFVTEFNELGEKLSERERKPSGSDLQVTNFAYWPCLRKSPMAYRPGGSIRKNPTVQFNFKIGLIL
ncbi:MAG: hypothetical protein P8Z37_05110 [Acidobacteriota bacterium]